MTGTDGAVWSIWWDANEPAGYRPEGWFLIHPEVKANPGATVTALWRNDQHLDLFMTGTDGAVWSVWWNPQHIKITDSYIARPAASGPYLREISSVLAVQGFIPEIRLGIDDESALVQFKRDYLDDWLAEGLPVIMDVSPGYDAHLVFPYSVKYGNNDYWRNSLKVLWSIDFKGMVFNTWNGYTEGYAAPATLEYGDSNYIWLRSLFRALI
jgi:hypothetical protein